MVTDLETTAKPVDQGALDALLGDLGEKVDEIAQACRRSGVSTKIGGEWVDTGLRNCQNSKKAEPQKSEARKRCERLAAGNANNLAERFEVVQIQSQGGDACKNKSADEKDVFILKGMEGVVETELDALKGAPAGSKPAGQNVPTR